MASSEFVRRNLPLVLKKRGEQAAQKILAVFADDWKPEALADFAKSVPDNIRPIVLAEIERRRQLSVA
jgi:hypothetical protein